jgi:hypothetical protein
LSEFATVNSFEIALQSSLFDPPRFEGASVLFHAFKSQRLWRTGRHGQHTSHGLFEFVTHSEFAYSRLFSPRNIISWLNRPIKTVSSIPYFVTDWCGGSENRNTTDEIKFRSRISFTVRIGLMRNEKDYNKLTREAAKGAQHHRGRTKS